MQTLDEEIHLLNYWWVLLKRRRIVLTIIIGVVGIVAVYSFSVTPIYQGTAQILIDLEKNPTMTFAEGAAYIQMRDPAEYYRTQVEILRSRAFGNRVVQKLQLNQNPNFITNKRGGGTGIITRLIPFNFSARSKGEKPQNPVPLAAIPEETDPGLTDIVLNHMTVEIGKTTNIIRIHYFSPDPMIAAALANGIAGTYIEHNLDIRVKPFRDAVEWLSARLVESRSRVEESEKVVQKYKENKGIVSFEPQENVISQKLQELMTQLVQAQSKRQEVEVRYKQIESVIGNTDLLATVPDIMNNPVIQGLRVDELALKKKKSELSDKYGPKHPQMIRANSELETVQKNLIAEARKMLNAAKTEYDMARGRETYLRKAIEEQKIEVLDLGRKAIDYGVIAGEAESNKQFYELLLKKLQEASLSSGINVSNAQIVDPATIPDSPVKPKRGINILLALAAGVAGGIFAAFFTEYMDNSIKTSVDIEKVLELPFLGYVPATVKEDGPIFMFLGSRASIAEAYRTIRTSIMLSSPDEKFQQVLLVTSSTPNEGKTTTAANIAVAMAQMGEKVLLVDTDMRRHNLHKVFKLENLVGISDMIVDHGNMSAGIHKPPEIPNLSVITGGTKAPNPSELLGSNSMRELLIKFRGQYDRVILDSPPLLVFSDPLVLTRLADGVVFVVHSGLTPREAIKKATQSIKGVGGRILGIVLNKVFISKNSSYYYPYYDHYHGYGYGYGYGYGAEEEGKKRSKKKKA